MPRTHPLPGRSGTLFPPCRNPVDSAAIPTGLSRDCSFLAFSPRRFLYLVSSFSTVRRVCANSFIQLVLARGACYRYTKMTISRGTADPRMVEKDKPVLRHRVAGMDMTLSSPEPSSGALGTENDMDCPIRDDEERRRHCDGLDSNK
jgi:hypothetical protein